MRARIVRLSLAGFVSLTAVSLCWGSSPATPKADLQVTAKSPEARADFENGLSKLQTLHLQDAFASWRKAVQEDPDFALAHIFLAQFSQDPAEQASERDKALASKNSGSAEEQLIVEWLASGSQGNWIAAIQKMNQVVQDYGRHKQVVWLAGTWLSGQQQWQRAVPMFERAIKMDASFADAWNSLAYCYAHTGQFEKAFAAMRTYATLLPKEPNPQDSFAEISRMAGRYNDALVHYRMSLKIDPSFNDSRLGIGDTYALMGQQEKARAAYDLAISRADRGQAVLWGLQKAATYVREKNYAAADTAFVAVAKQAHENDFGNLEAQAYRTMAMYQPDIAKADELLNKADAILSERHNVPRALINEERAMVYRTRVYRDVQAMDLASAGLALQQLESLAGASNDVNISLAWHSAAGDLLLAQGRYEDAIPSLQEDERNPFAMRDLVTAYRRTRASAGAEKVAKRLAAFNEPVIEQALVVPEFRRQWADLHPVSKPQPAPQLSASR